MDEAATIARPRDLEMARWRQGEEGWMSRSRRRVWKQVGPRRVRSAERIGGGRLWVRGWRVGRRMSIGVDGM